MKTMRSGTHPDNVDPPPPAPPRQQNHHQQSQQLARAGRAWAGCVSSLSLLARLGRLVPGQVLAEVFVPPLSLALLLQGQVLRGLEWSAKPQVLELVLHVLSDVACCCFVQ